MNQVTDQFQRQFKANPKKIGRLIALGVILLIAFILFLMSWTDVNPGEQGFIYRPYGGGVEKDKIYNEGTIFIAPWNEMITYNVRQQSRSYESQVMDINGTEIGLVVAVNYHAEKGKIASLHLLHGELYAESFVDKKVKGAIKDVVGRYTYEEVYSSKREALEVEIETIIEKDFDGNYIVLDFVEIADVNLPANIATEITVKETQKQKNKTSELKKIEEKNLADAKIETARGDSAKAIINAMSETEAIKIKTEQLRKSPQYIEYMKAKKWNGVLPQVMSGSNGLIIDLSGK
jgi:regulator of protease activity HflC (stomatin/prohibitin superfamily)